MTLIPPRWKCWWIGHHYDHETIVHGDNSRTVDEVIYICARCGHEKHHQLR